MADDRVPTSKGILGDINPNPSARDHIGSDAAPEEGLREENEGAEQSMTSGSRPDQSKHAGSRDVTDGTIGGARVGGTRNFRTGSGATGSDIGNRPE